MVWYGNRPKERFFFREIEWPSLKVGKEIGSIVGGSIDLGAFTDLKASGQLSYNGDEPNDVNLVQVLYEFTDTLGEKQGPFTIGTFLIEKQDVTRIPDVYGENRTRATGTLNAKSVLQVLLDDRCGMPKTIVAGTDATRWVRNTIATHDLKLSGQPAEPYTLASTVTFEAQDTLLTVVNGLLSRGGYRALQPADNGSVVMMGSSLGTSPVYTFDAGENSIMYPVLTQTRNYSTSPNMVKMYYSDEEVSLYAQAENTSGSRNSRNARGRRLKVDAIEVTELTGTTMEEKRYNLLEKAVNKVKDYAGVYEYVRISHDYVPIKPFDCVAVNYPDVEWVGHVTNMHINLAAGAKCDTEVRKYIADSVQITAHATDLSSDGGSIIWQ